MSDYSWITGQQGLLRNLVVVAVLVGWLAVLAWIDVWLFLGAGR